MKLPPAAYIVIAAVAGALFLLGVVCCLAGMRNWASFFSRRVPRLLDEKMGRRGARVFAAVLGGATALLGLALLMVSLVSLVPERRLKLVEPAGSKRPGKNPPTNGPSGENSKPKRE